MLQVEEKLTSAIPWSEITQQIHELSAAFNRKGLNYAFGGGAWLEMYIQHEEPNTPTREHDDIDLIVPQDSLESITNTLQELGYTVTTGEADNLGNKEDAVAVKPGRIKIGIIAESNPAPNSPHIVDGVRGKDAYLMFINKLTDIKQGRAREKDQIDVERLIQLPVIQERIHQKVKTQVSSDMKLVDSHKGSPAELLKQKEIITKRVLANYEQEYGLFLKNDGTFQLG